MLFFNLANILKLFTVFRSSNRHFSMFLRVKDLLFLIFCFGLVKNSSSNCTSFDPCPLTGGQNYQEPPVLESQNGRLEIYLSVEIGTLSFDWLTVKRRTYNGSIPGPTWRIKPGDYVTLTLINNLESTLEETRGPNTLRHPNVTNMHTHGLHISGEAPGDNVFIHIEPGNQYTYHYQIEDDQPAGTYWYHAHLHGSTMFQVQSGLIGMLIVEDSTTGLAAMNQHLADISCPDNCQNEVPLIFHPTLVYSDSNGLGRGFAQLQAALNDSVELRNLEPTNEGVPLQNWLSNSSNSIDHYTTNGILFPVLEFQAGQRKRFRMVNTGGSRTLELQITEEGSLNATDACEFWEIAFDGVYLDLARKAKLGKTFLPPAGRADWIVVCNRPGTYELRSVIDEFDLCSIGNRERHIGLLFTLQVIGNAVVSAPQNLALPKRPFYLSDFSYLPQSQVTGFFSIEANSRQFLNRERFSGPNNPRHKMRVGTVQEWYILNSDPIDGHPIHIHVNHFQIISYNQYTGPISTSSSVDRSGIVFYSLDGQLCDYQSSSYIPGSSGLFLGLTRTNGSSLCGDWNLLEDRELHSSQEGPGTLGYVTPGEFRDVIMIPPLSNITIRFLAHKFTTEVVIHCHILIHEDFGMMMTAEIVEDGESLEANALSGNALPGQCLRPRPTSQGLLYKIVSLFRQWVRTVSVQPQPNTGWSQLFQYIHQISQRKDEL